MKTKKKKEHYVNNADFLAALVEYRKSVKKAEKAKDKRPRVPEYVGECLMKIAVHLSYKPNFSNYIFRDEMVSDGIENCLQYIDNFDPEKSKNPFAYFTQIIYFAFLRKIAKEKKLLYTKMKLTERMNVMEETSHLNPFDSDQHYDTSIKMGEWSTEYVKDFIAEFEENKRKEKKRNEK